MSDTSRFLRHALALVSSDRTVMEAFAETRGAIARPILRLYGIVGHTLIAWDKDPARTTEDRVSNLRDAIVHEESATAFVPVVPPTWVLDKANAGQQVSWENGEMCYSTMLEDGEVRTRLRLGSAMPIVEWCFS